MCDKDLLVAYLYEDLAADDRARFEEHLHGCAECRAEVGGLKAVRTDLAAWAPPRPDLGFRVISEPTPASTPPLAPVLTSPRWQTTWLPRFGLAAAALLVLAISAAIAHVQIQIGHDGVAVRTGWGSAPSAAPAQQAANPSVAAPKPVSASLDPTLLQEFDRRIAALEHAPRSNTNVRDASLTTARMSDSEILHRVRDLVAQSETKENGELALRLSQLIHDVDAQRVADLTRIQQKIGQMDAMATADVATHRDLATYFLASQKQK